MTVRHISSWQHPHTTSKKMMGIAEPPYRVCFKCGKTRHWAKKTALVLTDDSLLSKLWTNRTLGSQLTNFAESR